jgi:short-subunit dehydrogenase
VKNTFDYVDVLINNAGVFLPGKLYDISEDNLYNQLNINLMSAYYCSRDLLQNMIARQSGHIVNICSIASLQGYPNGGAYAVSKFALLGFGKSLREELKPHCVKVTNVMPGATLTDSWSGTDIPAERFIDVHDLAQIIFSACIVSNKTVVEDIVIRPLQGDI